MSYSLFIDILVCGKASSVEVITNDGHMTANIMEVDSDSDSSPLLLRVERRDSISV